MLQRHFLLPQRGGDNPTQLTSHQYLHLCPVSALRRKSRNVMCMMYVLVPILKLGCVVSCNISATHLNIWSKGGTELAQDTVLTSVTPNRYYSKNIFCPKLE